VVQVCDREGHVLEDSFLSNPDNFRRTLLSVNDGVYMTDRERRIIFWNPACERITGFTAGEVLGRKCSDNILNHVDMNGNSLCDSSLCPLQQSMEKGVPGARPSVVRVRRRDGTRVAAEVNVAPLFDEQEQVIGGVEVFRDITEKQQLAEIKARFLSGLTHELKNPLTIMQGFIELVLSGDTGEINHLQREFLDSAMEEGDRFKKILDDLLDFTRYEATEYSFSLRDVDLSATLRQVAGSYSAEAARKKIAVVTDIPDDIYVFADGDRLRQAFANLLSNAIKYTEKGSVSITAGAAAEQVVVAVRDTGIGIPVEDQGRIFDQFYRVGNDLTLRVGGTGIGLSIVKKIIERHSGEIVVRSQPGAGSEFTVTLPLKGKE
jgi:two-component system phosphate regulon sensor histidine kinase PhoR